MFCLPSFGMLAFQNGLKYRSYDFKIFKGSIFSTFSANLMKIGQETPEIM